MASTNQFQNTGALNVGRSAFDLSYSKLFNCHFGQLIPVVHDECVPGDVWTMGNEIVCRTTPLTAPVLSEINVTVHYFFVSYNSIDSDFNDFITGGEDGADSTTLPRWDNHSATAKYSLWDYFGFPVGVTVPASDDDAPLDYPRLAYLKIWDYWYRDSVLQTAKGTTGTAILYRNWPRDYFTAATTAQQLGTAPTIGIGSTAPIQGIGVGTSNTWSQASVSAKETDQTTPTYTNATLFGTSGNDAVYLEQNGSSGYPAIYADLSSATGVSITDLRLQVQIQKWLERNARAGGRYSEFVAARFGVPGYLVDSRIMEPEYIGGTKTNIIISEIPNTSDTATADQGTLAGHGLAVDSQFAAKYHVKEHGMIMGLLSVMPANAVYSQGINRQWLHVTKYDFYSPEFANLSEEAITKGQIYYNGDANDDDTFGYIGRYDFMRTKQDLVAGDMRDTFDYWHLARQFSAAPTLNEAFIQCEQSTDDLDRIFASTTEPPFIVHINNKITALRPMPITSEPGLMDHF